MEKTSILSEESGEAGAKKNAIKLLNLSSDKEVASFYDAWAEVFDQQVAGGNKGALKTCFDVASHYVRRKDAFILDIGAGTGLAAAEFKRNGYLHIDGIEPSEAMLQKAMEKQMYEKTFKELFTDNNTYLQSDYYDLVISVGAFGGSQVQHTAVKELVRCVRSGGFVCIVTREGYVMEDSPIGQEMKRLEQAGKWRCLERKKFENYLYEIDGIVLLFEITKV